MTSSCSCCSGGDAGFAVGAMVNEGLKLIELADDAVHCAVNAADAALHASQIIFIFVQLHFIFIHSQVIVVLAALGYWNSFRTLANTVVM